jgi:hypothetical protein
MAEGLLVFRVEEDGRREMVEIEVVGDRGRWHAWWR